MYAAPARNAAALHWLASIPNAWIDEYVTEERTTLRDQLTREQIRARDGQLAIPQELGLGIDLNEENVNRFRVG